MTSQGRDWKSGSVEGVVLRFAIHEKRAYQGKPLYDWLLAEAHKLGVPGGSVHRGIAGYGRHGVLHDQHFFELAGDLPVDVLFVCTEADAHCLLDLVERHELSLFYVMTPAHYGVAGVEKIEGPTALPGVF